MISYSQQCANKGQVNSGKRVFFFSGILQKNFKKTNLSLKFFYRFSSNLQNNYQGGKKKGLPCGAFSQDLQWILRYIEKRSIRGPDYVFICFQINFYLLYQSVNSMKIKSAYAQHFIPLFPPRGQPFAEAEFLNKK